MTERADQELLATIRAELRQLLDAVPGARRVLAHLAVLESGLGELGLEAINQLPPAALEKATAQLAGLPMPNDAAGLPRLLMLMRMTIEDREHRQRHSAATPFLSSFLTEEKLSVKEASDSDFMRALDDSRPKPT